jgi:hypothetical protein
MNRLLQLHQHFERRNLATPANNLNLTHSHNTLRWVTGHCHGLTGKSKSGTNDKQTCNLHSHSPIYCVPTIVARSTSPRSHLSQRGDREILPKNLSKSLHSPKNNEKTSSLMLAKSSSRVDFP